MIFLKKHNLLFLKPRKVAGTSFEIALSRFADTGDIVTPVASFDEPTRKALGFQGPENYTYTWSEVAALGNGQKLRALKTRSLPLKFFNHITAREARKRLGAEVFDAAFKVSIVRNPFDKMVSRYFWAMREETDPPAFEDWLRTRPDVLTEDYDQYRINGRDIIDHYIRFENFEEDIIELGKPVPALEGLHETFSGITAKKGSRPKTARHQAFYENTALKGAIQFFNQDLIERFGYEAS